MNRRKAKQLTRHQGLLRDDRIFWIASDDRYAPRQYLGFWDIRGIRFVFIADDDRTRAAQGALDDLRSIPSSEMQPNDERWLILDTDHFIEGSHLSTFTRVISEAEREGIHVSLSRPCFEFWLLLHHASPEGLVDLSKAAEVKHRLKDVLGEYNKTHLKRDHYPPESILTAFQRARAWDANVTGGRIPSANTSRFYRLLEAILDSSSKLDLPEEFRDLLKP